jgi:hypothetical protein
VIFEIVNPSDPYTIEAPDLAIAAVACFLLGKGAYAFEPLDADKDQRVPIFLAGLAGDVEKWCAQKFAMTSRQLFDHVLQRRPKELIDCLQSCLIGRRADRDDFAEFSRALDDDKKIAELRIARHKRRVTSLNDIGRRAYGLAEQLRANMKMEAM